MLLVINAERSMELVEEAIHDLSGNIGEFDPARLQDNSRAAMRKLGEARTLLRKPHLREAPHGEA